MKFCENNEELVVKLIVQRQFSIRRSTMLSFLLKQTSVTSYSIFPPMGLLSLRSVLSSRQIILLNNKKPLIDKNV